jgi:thioredoxin reductase
LVDDENVEAKMSKIVSGDFASKTVKGENGDIYQADFLVLAVGAEANFLHVRVQISVRCDRVCNCAALIAAGIAVS